MSIFRQFLTGAATKEMTDNLLNPLKGTRYDLASSYVTPPIIPVASMVKENLLFWIDPSQASFLSMSGANIVGLISSSSFGLVPHMKVGAGAAVKGTLNGLDTVSITDSAWFANTSNIKGPYGEFTAFIIWKPTNDADNKYPWAASSGWFTSGQSIYMESMANVTNNQTIGCGTGEAANYTETGIAASSKWHLIDFTIKGNMNTIALRHNGVAETGTGGNKSQVPSFGMYVGGRGGTFTGQVAEVVIYSGSLSAQNIVNMEAYLNTKWAIY